MQSLKNINENIAFLKNVYKLSDEQASRFASNPQVMENAVNLYDFQRSVGTRLLGRDVITSVAGNGKQFDS